MTRLYRFDDVEIDLRSFRVLKAGKALSIEPKALNVLVFLVENRDRLIEKRELIDAVWGEAFVTENVLTRAIAQLRKALEDDTKETRYIETVPTRGYRFVAKVEVEPDVGAVEPVVDRTGPRPASSGYRWMLAAAGVAVVVALAVALALRQPAAPAGGEALGFALNQQLSSGDGLDINACFSPDGNLVAYASDRSGSFEIYIRSLESGARELQLTNNGNQNMYPSFSPDGRSVVFSSAKNPGIFRVAAIGGPIQRLTDFGIQPVWSPDGGLIVFRSHRGSSLATTDYYFPTDSSLWLVSADGGSPRQITNSGSPTGGQGFASWSPDGQEIRFVNYLASTVSLWTYRVRDGALQKRPERQLFSTFGSATFSRDSRRMYFVTSRLNGDIGISQLNLNPATLEAYGEEQPIYTPSVGVPRDLSMSPDGKHLVYSAIVSESKILAMGMKGDAGDSSEPTSVTREVSFRYLGPAWSPDGQSVAFTQLHKNQAGQVYVARLDGTPALPVSPSATTQFFLQFSADSSEVVYMQSTSPRLLKATKLADGATRILGDLPRNIDAPEVSPDGSEIVYNDVSGSVPHLWKQNLRTGARTQLTFGPEPSGFGCYSRDGKWLAVQFKKGSDNNIALMPSSGGAATPIWSEPGQWWSRSWSPDDSKILPAGNTGDGWALYWISRDGKQSKQITKTLPLRMYVRYPKWSPDGKKIVYEFNESKGNVFVAELK